jgi:hypothetical protein
MLGPLPLAPSLQIDGFGELITQCVSMINMPRGERPGQLRAYLRLLLVRFKVLLRLNQIMQCVGMLKTLRPVMDVVRVGHCTCCWCQIRRCRSSVL